MRSYPLSSSLFDDKYEELMQEIDPGDEQL